MVVCRYCALESAVSHASERECIVELKREVTRLDHLLHGQPSDSAVVQPGSEAVARRVIEPGGSRVWSPSADRGRSAAIGLSLLESNR
jgi:hypothetical protein